MGARIRRTPGVAQRGDLRWRADGNTAVRRVRLAFFPPDAATVRVAALAPDRELNDAVDAAPGAPRPLPAATRTEIQQYLNPLADDLFTRTAQAARGGAKIVVWSEAAAFVFKEDEASFLERAQSIARQEHIYLQIGLVSLLPTDRYPTNENRAIMIDPNGSVSWDYPKATEVFTTAINLTRARSDTGHALWAAGHGHLLRRRPTAAGSSSRKGRHRHLAGAIKRLEGIRGSAQSHGRLPRCRERRCAGTSNPARYVDCERSPGRLLGYKSDYFVGSDHTMIVNVPMSGAGTLYARTGESIGWLCVFGVPVLMGLAWMRRRQSRSSR